MRISKRGIYAGVLAKVGQSIGVRLLHGSKTFGEWIDTAKASYVN